MSNNKYSCGLDIDSKTSRGVFCVWDRKKNTIHMFIDTRFIKIWLFIFWIKGIKVLKENT